MKRVLVTGGAGFIGSHTCVELLNSGFEIVVLDNFSNSSRNVIRKLEELTGKSVPVVEASIEKDDLSRCLSDYGIDSVVHFAALKSVSESIESPLDYYDVNVVGTVRLLQWAIEAGVERIVFSSSATVYGYPSQCPVDENAQTNPLNPYGDTKLACEKILQACNKANPRLKVAILRYFNPAGAHESGDIGESPMGVPANLFPFLGDVLKGRFESLQVFGTDYPTRDGTGVRDYIHVMDLAEAHVSALAALQHLPGFCVNVGTGTGYSVLEVAKAFEAAAGVPIKIDFCARRAGDAAEVYADTALSKIILNWQPSRSLQDMCRDAVRWYRASCTPETRPEAPPQMQGRQESQ